MKYEDDIPELGEFRLPYPKNPPLKITLGNDKNYNGVIIEIEGLDGSGKSSQVKILEKRLKERYKKVLYINFIHSEYLKNILLKTKWENCDSYTFTFMYIMGLSNVYHREILPRLDEGYIILLDRYIYTIMTKAMINKNVKEEWIRSCLSIFKTPDIKIFIDTPVQTCLERKKKDNKILSYWECGGNIFDIDVMRKEYNQDLFQCKFIEYQSIIRDMYIDFINKEGWNCINGDNSIENISDAILNIVEKFIKNREN